MPWVQHRVLSVPYLLVELVCHVTIEGEQALKEVLMSATLRLDDELRNARLRRRR